MAIQKFEDIIAWQKAQDLAVEIYSTFQSLKDFGFKDQICRAVVSISNNIAEGFDRSSDADFSRFLYFSIASCSEVKSMIHLANRLNYISDEQKLSLLVKANEVSKIIRGLIKSLNSRKVKGVRGKLLGIFFLFLISTCNFCLIVYHLNLTTYA